MSKPKKKSKGKPESKPEPTMIDRRRELLVLGHLLKRQGKIPYVVEAALFAQNQTWGSPLSEFDMLTISREISRPAKARKPPKPSDSDGSVMQHTAKHGREIANNEVEIAKEEAAANAEQSRKELHEMLLKVPVSPVQLVSDLEAYFAKYLSLSSRGCTHPFFVGDEHSRLQGIQNRALSQRPIRYTKLREVDRL